MNASQRCFLAQRVTLALGLLCSLPGSLRAQACHVLPGRDALWSLAQCCPKSLASNRDCAAYDAKDEYIILKDDSPRKTESYMIIPTLKVTGIEDPRILSLPVLDFWADGWLQSRKYPGQPEPRTAMAINSAHARTQNQLHIHISCIRSDVKRILDAKAAGIGVYPAKFLSLELPPNNHVYRAVRVSGLSGVNSPFEIIQTIPGVNEHMGNQSIAVAPSQQTGEFYVLNSSYTDERSGDAEELLNETCANGGASNRE